MAQTHIDNSSEELVGFLREERKSVKYRHGTQFDVLQTHSMSGAKISLKVSSCTARNDNG